MHKRLNGAGLSVLQRPEGGLKSRNRRRGFVPLRRKGYQGLYRPRLLLDVRRRGRGRGSGEEGGGEEGVLSLCMALVV